MTNSKATECGSALPSLCALRDSVLLSQRFALPPPPVLHAHQDPLQPVLHVCGEGHVEGEVAHYDGVQGC